MKTLTILLVLFCNCAFGQLSISIGANRWSETQINLQDHFLKPFDGTLRYSHLKKQLGVSYQHGRHLFSGEFNHFQKRDIPFVTGVSSISGGGSSPIYNYSKTYRAQVSYAYTGFKLGYAYTFEGTSIFSDKWKSMVELGGFFGFDFLTSHSERNHSTHEKASNNSNMTQTTVVTIDEKSSEPFNAVEMRKMPGYSGLYAAKRITIGNVFIRGAISYGTLNYATVLNVRLTPLNTGNYENGGLIESEPERKRFFSTDISIGYTFN